ncbi:MULTISPECIES: RHS repeat-associated core domain-containing protein [Rhodobacterales]|uniref:RHS repeat-associated core domain-containing protein n=1 Tax=Rhodobacterales TaxID=204455 RepID=UPI0011BEF544|nr:MULTISPECIES: RHS repeat-associated core domain-containing protein [Rhodobacterales]MDO6591963.1 RHS repeat-associated core domain-containing protein [Yoonia sp. 1_MG-2023]
MENPLAQDDILLEFEAGTEPFLARRWAHSVAVDEPLGYEEYLSTQDPGTGVEHAMFSDRLGAIKQTQGAMQQPYGYTGREFDAENGLYHYRARSYDPLTGMFLQSDPIGFGGGQLGLYAYVGNNSSNLADPSGLSAVGNSQVNNTTDRSRKGAFPPIAYGVGVLAGRIADVFGQIKLVNLPAAVRNDYPGAGRNSSPLGENDPACLAAKEAVRQAKAFRASVGGSCTPANDPANPVRLVAARREALARQTRDIVCPMNPSQLLQFGVTPLGERIAKENAFGHWFRCSAIIQVHGSRR